MKILHHFFSESSDGYRLISSFSCSRKTAEFEFRSSLSKTPRKDGNLTELKAKFCEKLEKITKQNGIVFINVFVEKSFLELPPDWDKEEKMWKSGELFTYFPDWKVERINEVIFEDNSGGFPHYHCMDTIVCRKIK